MDQCELGLIDGEVVKDSPYLNEDQWPILPTHEGCTIVNYDSES